jgi:5'-nucleotidase
VGLYKNELLPRRPDLVVSGINHGYNLASDTFYSGTVAAAREGALRGVPAMAISHGSGPGGSFEAASEVAVELVQRFLRAPKPVSGHAPLLSVNFPAGRSEYRGVKTTRLGLRSYDDSVVARQDPRGQDYYWIGGPNAHHERIEGSDTAAVDDGFVSVTPLVLDGTSERHLTLAALVAGGEGA